MKFVLVFLYIYQAFIFNELNEKKDIIFFEDINLIGINTFTKKLDHFETEIAFFCISRQTFWEQIKLNKLC